MPVVLRTVLIAVLAVGLAAGIFFGVRGCSSGTGSLADGGTVISGANPSDQFCAMGQVFLAFDGSYARAYDVKKGELLWERSPDGSQGYQCDTSAQLAAIYKGSTLYVYDTAGSVAFSVTTAQPIAQVRAGQASVAVRYADDSIEIIDKTGKSVEVIQAENGAVMDYGMYSGSDLMWVLMLDDTGIEPRSQLNIHQPGKLLIAGYSTSGQLYYKPLMYGSQVYICGTRTIDVRSTSDATASSVQVYGWTLRDSYAGAEQMSLLLTLSEQGKDATALRVITGTKVTDLRMHAGCTDLMMGNGRVWGLAGQTLYSVPVSGGKTQSYSLPYAADGVLLRVNETQILLSAEGAVRLVTLPAK